MTWDAYRESYMARVEVRDVGECWPWGGSVMAKEGYGQFAGTTAHRLAYYFHYDEVPDTVDHLCRTRWCQNPHHMENVTRGENTRRGIVRRPACPKGHVYDEANTYIRPKGGRVCRACRRAGMRNG